ncbi:MAG: prolyl aminopeptidase [Psychrobium sp.]|nr:prolyl aminopeptidase [Psychrobium sp.]
MHTLYPAIKPYSEFFVAVSSLHRLSVSQSGNPKGVPVVVLHGGPGGARSQRLSQFFDPQRYRIILFDQRGCGQSLPYGELKENDASALIDDIDKIRQSLNIEKWLVVGGSWGGQLALRYGFAYPARVSAFVLRSPFLGRKQDFHWRFCPDGGAAQIFPDHYQSFSERLPLDQRHEPIKGYQQLFETGHEFEQLNAARQWSIWKGGLSHLLPLKDAEQRFGHAQQSLALAKIESHYYSQHCFMPENHILDNIDKISHLSAIIVHGRYDMVCKLEGSQLLSKEWPNSQLQIIPGAGHSSSEPAVIDALIQACDKMVTWLY